MSPDDWFAARGWQPFGFQREVWAAMHAGRSGLLHATTGSGKTLAVWIGALLRGRTQPAAAGLQVLWITPMRALAADTTRALAEPLAGLAPMWRVGQRTGDTPAAERARQDRRMPEALVTTPESLTLLLTRERAAAELAGIHTVVVDEWHELIGSKRGVQLQLALARLKRFNPGLVTWGLSATLGNLHEAMATLAGQADATLVRGVHDKALVIDTLLPVEPGRFSWGGHLGAQMLEPVVREIERSGTTLVFTNTRSQAETWYQLLLDQRPDWAGLVALHHGSLDKAVREWVEAGLKQGQLKAVVATSSLDLGVDFLPVERVLQIGSAKGVARLLQRAGRSGHAPGRTSRVTLVPTNTLELVEAAAARRAAQAGRVESRASPEAPLDVLVQHIVTVATGGGFEADALFDEVRTAPAYRALPREAFDWALAFCERGGDSLSAYPEYHRIRRHDDGRWRVADPGIARRHKLMVGTIVSDASMAVKWASGAGAGATLGHVEEGFIARLNKGDCFVFAGRVLEFVRTHEMAALVRVAKKSRGVVPAWAGGKMPLSSELADSVQALLDGAARGDFGEPELQAAMPMLQAQARLSRLPVRDALLVERFDSREGHHVFLYPFAGRNVHIGLAQLLAWRLANRVKDARPNTFSLSVNDYGLEIVAAAPLPEGALDDPALLGTQDLLHDVLASLNSGQLAQRRFREIARVAGLVFGGYPGAPKSLRQLQASSSLFFEVFRQYDAGNRLLTQAEGEVLAQELELSRLQATLERLQALPRPVVALPAPSPFALPLMIERLREQLSTEKLKDRLERLVAEGEAALAGPGGPPPRRRRRA
ncbi:MAG: ligase-associated DNA damage response DEXH box helicase [Burkholderiaceae bacterium]|nr:ligase-associated DNA damage response DEXH box helicase [Burkholderiaceae bacterium]